MSKKLILGLLIVIFGATLALPSYAANIISNTNTPKPIKNYWLNYGAANADNGAIAYFTSSNPAIVAILHNKYDNLQVKTYNLGNGNIEADLIKINKGIQLNFVVKDGNQHTIANLQDKISNAAKPTFYRRIKVAQFLKNNFNLVLY